MTDEKKEIDPSRLPHGKKPVTPNATHAEKVIRALSGVWSRAKAEKIFARMQAHNLIDLRFKPQDETSPERLQWWLVRLDELFPGIDTLTAANTYDRLEALGCLVYKAQRIEQRETILSPATRLTVTQETILREAAKQPHGFFVKHGTNSGGTTWNILCTRELARESTSKGVDGRKTYITPAGRRAIEDMDTFRLTYPDEYAKTARRDVNIMQLNEVRKLGLPLGAVSPAHDVSRKRGWEDCKAGPEAPEARTERIRTLHVERDKASAARKADPFEGVNEEGGPVKKRMGRPKGSKNKKEARQAPKRTTSSKKRAKKASKKTATKKEAKKAPATSPRKVPGQSAPKRIQVDPKRKAAAQAALAKLKNATIDPFED